MNDNEIIQKILKFIKTQIGLSLTADTYFTGIKRHNRKKYFNAELPGRVSESDEYALLERFAKKIKIISVEPNGVNRVAIFFDDAILNHLDENIIMNPKQKLNLKEIIRRIVKEERTKLIESKMNLQQAKELAKKQSKENGGAVQHVNELGDGSYEVSDWYDNETTVWSCEGNREF